MGSYYTVTEFYQHDFPPVVYDQKHASQTLNSSRRDPAQELPGRDVSLTDISMLEKEGGTYITWPRIHSAPYWNRAMQRNVFVLADVSRDYDRVPTRVGISGPASADTCCIYFKAYNLFQFYIRIIFYHTSWGFTCHAQCVRHYRQVSRL